MKKIIFYKAEDGQLFRDEKSCLEHERETNEEHRYNVNFVLHGTVSTVVTAHSEEEATQLAEKTFWLSDVNWNIDKDKTTTTVID